MIQHKKRLSVNIMNVLSPRLPSFVAPCFGVTRAGESSLLITIATPVGSQSIAPRLALDNGRFDDSTLDNLSLIDKNTLLLNLQTLINDNQVPWLTDSVLSYESLLVEYNDKYINHYELVAYLQGLHIPRLNPSHDGDFDPTALNIKTHVIPVCYDYDGPEKPHDREQIIAQTGLSLSQVISMHCERPYRIFALGFMPSFAYLGELTPRLQIPRLANPRLKVPPGAVAIADNQTAVYPSSTPGGWHIIGYTPINLLKHPDFIFEAGQQIKFESISVSEFTQYEKQAIQADQSHA
jgi:KipI family sensor histidine kinase inhibitor